MANVNKVAGLKPVGYLNGSPWSGKARTYVIPSTDATAYYVGDPVTLAGGADVNGVASVSIGVAGATCVGVIVGVAVAPAGVSLQGTTIDLTSRSIPATKAKDYYVMVADDPAIIFEIQDTAGTIVAADIGLNCNFTIAAGSTTTGDSGTFLGSASKAVTSTLNLKLLGLAQREDNAFGAFAKVLVQLNNHAFSTGVAGV